MEIQNLLNAIYNSKTPVSNDALSRLNIGDLLKAKVLAIAGDIITLEINNKLVVDAKDTSSILYNIGDSIEFVVTDTGDDQLFIKSNISESTILESKLSELGIKLNEDNKELIDLLFKSQIPITKENISTIMSTKNYYGKLAQFINESNFTANSEMLSVDVKEVLKNLIQENLAQENLPQENDVTETNKASGTSEKMVISDEVSKTNNNLPFINEFVESKADFSLEKLVFMLKNDMNFNAKNIVLLDNLIFGKNTITNQIETLIQAIDEKVLPEVMEASEEKTSIGVLDKLEKKDIPERIYSTEEKIKITKQTKNQLLTLLSKFDVTNIKDKDKLDQAMKELFERFETIKNSVVNKDISSVLNKHFEEIKASIDFIGKLNENMAFIQVPLYMNNTTKNLDIYIKKDTKSNKKINVNNSKIFISLNTNNLDLVQVLIEIKKKNINLNFRVANEKVKNIIESNESILSTNLKEYDFNDVIFKYCISTEKINLTNLELNTHEDKLSTIDIRV